MGEVPRPAGEDELEAVLDLIVGQQARPDRNVPAVGTDRAGVRAELEDLEPPWTHTLRIVGEPGTPVVGASLVDWSVEAATAWVNGPWIDAADEDWLRLAEPLVAAAVAQTPRTVTSYVMSADVAHHLVAALAGRLGWPAGDVNHVLVASAETVTRWPPPTTGATLRPATAGDLEPIRRLHDHEFPSTYFTASELIERAGSGRQTVLVAEHDDGEVFGYVAGQIQPDGDGYIDFVAVAPAARRAGVGRALVHAICRELIRASTTRRICLTVQDPRHEARALYTALGFEVETSIVGYRETSASA